MRRLLSAVLVLALASAVHLDWHLARSAHHHGPPSFGWEHHWVFAAAAFAVVGCAVARAWPERAGRVGASVAALAILLAQGVESVAEVALYDHRLGYPDEPARWAAFLVCLAAGLPAYALALRLCRPGRRRSTEATVAPAS